MTTPGASPMDRLRCLLVRGAPWLIALCVYIVAAVVTTWPVAADPGGTVFGTPGDATGNITLLRYRNDLGVGPLSNAVTPDENAPFGIALPGAISLPQVVVEGPAQLVAAISGNAVVAYNLAVISGLVLTAFACFALCVFITGNPWASGVAGVAYGFNPWIVERAHGHVHFTHLWSLPLIVLALVWIRRGAGWRGWLAFGLALTAAAYTNTYVSLFAATIIGAFIVADMGAAALRRSGRRLRDAFSRACFAAALLVAVMLPQAIVSVVQADKIDGLLAGTRSPQDLYTYGSRWWEWLVPSYRHPVFDEWTAPYLIARQHLSNPSETTLYLGTVMLLLAAAGVAVTVLARRRGTPAWPGALAMCLVVAGLIISLPRGISPFGFEIPMPSAVLSQIVEPWRVYARLFAVVALGVALLAAIGLTRLLAALPRRVVPVAAVALAALVAFDLSLKSTSFSAATPAVYEELARQPDEAPRVEYPLTPPTQAPHLSYIFYTEAAGRPLVNGGRAGTTGGAFHGRMFDPLAPWTAPALAGLGARWAVLHSHIYGGPPPVLGAGYRFVGDFDGSMLYAVTAEPPPVMAVPGDGFGGPEQQDGGRFAQWLNGAEGAIAVINTTDRPRSVSLRFTTTSFYRPRDVTVTQAGAVIARKRVFVRPTPMEFTTTVPPGLTSLDISATPGADAIARVLRNQDPRRVTLRLSGITAHVRGSEPFRLG